MDIKQLELSLVNEYQREKKDCPKCKKTIHKKGDQMYCYHCYTPFFWDTLEVIPMGLNSYVKETYEERFERFYINVNKENPLDFDIPRDINTVKNTYKHLFYIQNKVLPLFDVNYIKYNKYLRNKLLKGDITLPQFSQEIEKKGKELIDKQNIYNILVEFLTTSFNLLYSFRKKFIETHDKWNTRWFSSTEYKTLIELLNKNQDILSTAYTEYNVDIKKDSNKYMYL